jgi:hypothetical protein
MASLNELVYDIEEIVNHNYISDDVSLSKRQIAFWISSQRALLIRQELNKGRSIDPAITQTLSCVGLEVVSSSDCCSDNSECMILRTIDQIPKPISTYSKQGITRVAPINMMSKPYLFVPQAQAIFSGNGRFNSQQRFAFYKDGYIYIKLNTLTVSVLKRISITGVFDNPKDVSIFNNCDGSPCFSWDDEYPMSSWMIDYVKEGILKLDISMLKQLPTDRANDSSGEQNSQS